MNKKIDYDNELNPAQLEAVRLTEGPLLVIAGAGSGKTRTLVYRVAHLVENGVSPENILLLTFTRRAAEEMLKKSSQLLDERCSRVSGGTFHSFANMILRKYSKCLDIKNTFTILDESDAEDAINLIRAKLGFNKLDKRFPRKRAILDVISKSINKSEDLKVVLYDEYPQFIEWVDAIEKIKSEYAEYKRSKSLLDYDDLLVYLKDLLLLNNDVRIVLSRRYKYIMVDEYQDTNKLQAYIVCLLASENQNVMVVGDDSQSIYSFRGANFKNIIDFPGIFKKARIITLEENYRSTQTILDLTNEVIRHAEEKFEKRLYTRKQGGRLPIYVDAKDENSQSKYVADKIIELREGGLELGDIAVLFRSGWHSNDLEVELAGRNIPFIKYGGQKFVEAAHIKDILSYLRVTYNFLDQVSWYRLLLLTPGVGPKTAERLIARMAVGGVLDKVNSEKAIEKNASLRELFDILKKVNIGQNSPSELIRVFLGHYQVLLREKYDDFNKRINDLDSLMRIAGRYNSLEKFLCDMALEPPERSIVEAGSRDKDDSSLTLSTIHSAKGLEWHTVFVIYVAEGHIPSYLSLENKEQIEEERRLFYVALTRAKENLFLLKPHIDRSPRSYFDESASVFTRLSRFMEEGDILHKLIDVEDANGIDFDIDDLEEARHEAVNDDNKEFLEMMKKYFRK